MLITVYIQISTKGHCEPCIYVRFLSPIKHAMSLKWHPSESSVTLFGSLSYSSISINNLLKVNLNIFSKFFHLTNANNIRISKYFFVLAKLRLRYKSMLLFKNNEIQGVRKYHL